MELITNADAGNKCDDWTKSEPWVEASLWGYNYDGTDTRCHFCKELVGEPKPFEAVCGTESCIAFWALNMMDRKRG